MNLFTKQKQTHGHRKQTYGSQREQLVGVGGDKLGVWNKHTYTTIYTINKQQRSTVQHRELYSMSCNESIMEKNLKKNIYLSISESLCSSPETNPTL